MVAHQILVLLAQVRVLVGQPKTPPPRRLFVPGVSLEEVKEVFPPHLLMVASLKISQKSV